MKNKVVVITGGAKGIVVKPQKKSLKNKERL